MAHPMVSLGAHHPSTERQGTLSRKLDPMIPWILKNFKFMLMAKSEQEDIYGNVVDKWI